MPKGWEGGEAARSLSFQPLPPQSPFSPLVGGAFSSAGTAAEERD